jgi:hypothetical protein
MPRREKTMFPTEDTKGHGDFESEEEKCELECGIAGKRAGKLLG